MVLFPREDLRQVVETAKRILTKEKIDRQLAGQTSLMPFMNIKDEYTSKKATFDTQNSLDEKIDRPTSLMSKLTAEDDDQIKQFKPKIYQSKGEDRQEISTIAAMVREITKIDIGQIVETGEYCSVAEYNMDRIIETDQGITRTIEVILEEEILEGISD